MFGKYYNIIKSISILISINYSVKFHRSWFASKIENLKVDKPEKINMDTNERKNIVITFKNVSHHYDIHIFEIFELVDLEEVKTEYSSNCRIEKSKFKCS